MCYLRTVEDAGPYEYDLFVGFKQTEKTQFEHLLDLFPMGRSQTKADPQGRFFCPCGSAFGFYDTG
jgi:hypothetical protein